MTRSVGDLGEFLRDQPSLAHLAVPLQRAAESPAPVLVVGEPGTGRTRLARALHRASGRGPLVESDVGLIQATLFEGELFGHRRGAFTGAVASRQGLVARAEGGTLVLDRVEELPAGLQPKLLRLLAESRYAPLGGRERTADVRFVSVAGDQLDERVRLGAFREDLFYRLEVLSFRLPPLRRRREDIGPLIDAMLLDAADRVGRPCPDLDAGSRRWMLEHPWPGNLRELRNAIERALLLHDGGALRIEPPARSAGAAPRSLEEIEAEAIRDTLRHTRGHQGQAAEILGISRKTLWEKRRRYDIP